MGKWSVNQEKMKHEVQGYIIRSLWDKIISTDDNPKHLELDEDARFKNKMKDYEILKKVLQLLKPMNDQYVETEGSKAFDTAIREGKFTDFKNIVLKALHDFSFQKLIAEGKKVTEITFDDIDNESDKILAEIQNGEHLSLPIVDNSNPHLTKEDIADLTEYMQEKQIAASVAITNDEQSFVVPHGEFGENPIFSIHSVAKVFTGILLMKMMMKDENGKSIIDEDDLDKPVDLSEAVLAELSPAVREHLKAVTLRDIMVHKSGLGDYLDNPTGHSAAIESALNQHLPVPTIYSSHDLLKYGVREQAELAPVGQFCYSNMGMLLLGFAIEKKYQDNQRANNEVPLLTIDDLMQRLAKADVKMSVFENRRPPDGRFNTTSQRNPKRELLTEKGVDYATAYVSARFATTAGGYWTTNEDLQKFGKWIKDECERDSRFRTLIEKHGSEFYNKDKQAVEHSGIHADTAHFYTSLRNGTVITVLSEQGERAATNLADMIQKQTTWFKQTSGMQQVASSSQSYGQDEAQARTISPAFLRATTTLKPPPTELDGTKSDNTSDIKFKK